MPKRVKILAKLWLLYFLITIALIGFSVSVMFYFPIIWLSRFFPAIKGKHDRNLQLGIWLLMHVQPWFKARVRIELPQTENGILLVSNHRSHLDVFVLLSRIPGIRVLAKSSLFKIPFLGTFMRASRQIRVERGRLDAWVGAMREVGERLKAGERVHVFPEMTRCNPGLPGIQNFTSGPFLVAIQEDVSVVPIVFKNTDGVWPKGDAGLTFRAPVEVSTLEPLRARDFSTADALKSEVARRIEAELSRVGAIA